MYIGKYALVCSPTITIAKGLRIEDIGAPDFERASAQHEDYVHALIELGYTIRSLESNPEYPDSVFVEDPALIVDDVLIRMRMGIPSRVGEEEHVMEVLQPHFSPERVFAIQPPGTIEGGDVVVANGTLYVGMSKRTNEAGVDQLEAIMQRTTGYSVVRVPIPDDVLHLKGGASYHAASDTTPELLIVSERFASAFVDATCDVLVVPIRERFGANCISEGGAILVHEWARTTIEKLERLGFVIRRIDTSEFAKIDGAMSCLSKLYVVL